VERFVQGVKALQPLLVLLFGSVAKGDFTQRSDADVLAVFAEPTDWLAVYSYSQGRVQPVVKTLDEMRAGLEAGEPFFFEMLEDGIILYDTEETHWRLVILAQEARQRWGLVRVKGGWRWT